MLLVCKGSRLFFIHVSPNYMYVNSHVGYQYRLRTLERFTYIFFFNYTYKKSSKWIHTCNTPCTYFWTSWTKLKYI